MVTLSYVYVALGAAFVVASALMVSIGAATDARWPRVVEAAHQQAPVVYLYAAAHRAHSSHR